MEFKYPKIKECPNTKRWVIFLITWLRCIYIVFPPPTNTDIDILIKVNWKKSLFNLRQHFLKIWSVIRNLLAKKPNGGVWPYFALQQEGISVSFLFRYGYPLIRSNILCRIQSYTKCLFASPLVTSVLLVELISIEWFF